ncbi:MAG: ribosomal protein S18-alanine N-acetyltransferase [Firmicutes bacterium]|mgnify:FL=1|nr:ribosomal protein S18-alanine N-acetyltransferase [Bacillota bacterium]
MEIKNVELCNLDEIFEISNCYFDWSKKQLEESLKTGNIFLAAEQGNEIVAFLLAEDLIDSFNLLLIATKNEFKNKNIATKLMQKLEEIAKNKKIEKIWLEVRENNIPAINLYKKNDFKNIYLRRNYYKNGENALIFEKLI